MLEQSALSCVREPLKGTSRRFAPQVAETLIDQLMRGATLAGAALAVTLTAVRLMPMTVTLTATPSLCRNCFWRRNEIALRKVCSIYTSTDRPTMVAQERPLLSGRCW